MKYKFTKMQGTGNDFIMLDGIRQALTLTPERIRQLTDRHFGIGADQLLVVERPTLAHIDFKYRIFNANGGEVEHCGNGARCFLKFVQDKGLTQKQYVQVQVQKGVITLMTQPNGEILVNMGRPDFNPASLSFNPNDGDSRLEGDDIVWPLEVEGRLIWLSLISMGNPHAVQAVDDIDVAPVLADGPKISEHPYFHKHVNVGFMQIIHRRAIQLRVYERGVGETLACGTGACAAVVAGIRRRLLDSPTDVYMRGGRLTITWQGEQIYMAGDAVVVFEGEIVLP